MYSRYPRLFSERIELVPLSEADVHILEGFRERLFR